MADYIPNPDAEFNTWQDNLYKYASANLADLGLTAADLTPITTARSAWATTYSDHIAKQAAAQVASQAKSSARDDYEALLRSFVQGVQAKPNVNDKHRAGLQINVRSTSRTPANQPGSSPVATVDTSHRLRHTINFNDEHTPTRRAKPEGVLGCEIWVKVGDPAPTGPSQLHFLATDTATPYIAQYGEAEANKVAHYMLRWVNRKGETGPWSQTVSATITG
jgi:hypothetical protein